MIKVLSFNSVGLFLTNSFYQLFTANGSGKKKKPTEFNPHPQVDLQAKF